MLTIEARSSDESDPTHSRQFQEPRSQDNAFRKANGIFYGGSKALNSTRLSMPALEDDNEADASMGTRNPRGKRPALGHKPARFSLQPNIRKPSAGLHDPVDSFSTYGKLQYASDEIQKHTCGSISNINDNMPSANSCSRWTGILGNSVSYMHHYSSAVFESDDTFLSSQEAIQDDSLCPSKFVSQQETAYPDTDLQGNEIAESISKTEKRINELLDSLLSESIENLDGDGAPSLMQGGLWRKPVNVDKYLPVFSGTGRTGKLNFEKEFPKNRKSRTDIPKLMRGLSGKTPVKSKNVAENPLHTLASPTTPKSPFAALSLLNKHISRSNPCSNPFMDLDIDLSSARNASSLEEFNRLSQQLDDGKELTISDTLTSPTEVESTRTALTGTVSKHSIERVSPNLLDISVNVNPGSSLSIDAWSSGSNDVVTHHNGDNNMTDSARANADTRLCTHVSNRMAENVQGRYILQEAISYPRPYIDRGESSSCTNVDSLGHGNTEPKFKLSMPVEDMHQDTTSLLQLNVNTDCSTSKNSNFFHSPSGQSDCTFTKGLLVNGQPIAADSTFRKDLKQRNKALKRGSAKDIRKARTNEDGRRKAITWQSLRETGTYRESGVRRSKRIRSRPLEYWKGERFLYGRVHEGLATVIGIKCMSPAEESKETTLRVSSFVSDKHKELVELAARH